MRPIKFRVWNHERNQMIYLSSAGIQYFDFEEGYVMAFSVDGYDGYWAHEHYDSVSKKASKFPVMQFTGLHDKNGKEIYEGDIIKSKDWFDNDVVGVVVFQEPSGYWVGEEINTKETDFLFEITKGGKCGIIGNIYENPELVKSESFSNT